MHVLIGLGEAVVTALTVSSVLAVRPDLVRAARYLLPTGAALASRPEAARGAA